MASEYKKRGGDYNTSKEEGQSESQKHLENWTKEEWQTKEGEGTARQDDDSRKRYLPKKAWEELNDEEKEETDEKKVQESKTGKQFVGNTGKAKEARRRASFVSVDQAGEYEGDRAEKKDEKKDEGAKHGKKDDNSSKEKSNSGAQGAGSKRRAKQETTPNKKQKDEVRMQSLRKRK